MANSSPSVLPSSRRALGIRSSPFGSPAAMERVSDTRSVGPRLCAPGFPRDCPFRGHCVIGAGWADLELELVSSVSSNVKSGECEGQPLWPPPLRWRAGGAGVVLVRVAGCTTVVGGTVVGVVV